jgi:hypothetical protein
MLARTMYTNRGSVPLLEARAYALTLSVNGLAMCVRLQYPRADMQWLTQLTNTLHDHLDAMRITIETQLMQTTAIQVYFDDDNGVAELGNGDVEQQASTSEVRNMATQPSGDIELQHQQQRLLPNGRAVQQQPSADDSVSATRSRQSRDPPPDSQVEANVVEAEVYQQTTT